MMTAAASTDRSLVWPHDVADSGDPADAFRARLDALARRAHTAGLPRYKAALNITEIASAPVTRPAIELRDPEGSRTPRDELSAAKPRSLDAISSS